MCIAMHILFYLFIYFLLILKVYTVTTLGKLWLQNSVKSGKLNTLFQGSLCLPYYVRVSAASLKNIYTYKTLLFLSKQRGVEWYNTYITSGKFLWERKFENEDIFCFILHANEITGGYSLMTVSVHIHSLKILPQKLLNLLFVK